MRFLVDENLPGEAAALLREAGHEAASVAELHLSGSPDFKLAEFLKSDGRALVTLDVDFGNTQLYPPPEYSGLVVLRLQWQDRPHVLEVLKVLAPKLLREKLAGKLWIVDEDRIRIR